MSPAPKVASSPASKTVADKVSASKPSHAETTVSAPVGFRVASSASIEDKPTGPASVSGQKPGTPDISVARLDLWQEAYAEVDKKTREWIDGIPSVTNAKQPVDELVELVRCSKQKHQEDALKLKVSDREILWRDYANRVISVLTAIGDVAIPFAPAPASTVWSAVKVLLSANMSQCKDLVAIMGCTNMILCLVRRGRVYEEVYLNEPPMPTEQEDLRRHLVKVYTTCLDFLAFVNEEMQQGNLGRFLDALLDPGHGEQRLSEVKALEQQLDFAARACEAKAGSEHRKLLQSLEGPLKRVDNNVTAVLKKLQSDERRRVMEYISIVPVGSYHNEKRESRTKDTCEWLVAHPKFLEWEDFACSSVF
ncbi:hypothetical protein CcaCcLH18_09493 [Colletotrichum camelliae]|nr:hypothetical protein CcaCcLH18_09493 [Colletotrichum camelliae]